MPPVPPAPIDQRTIDLLRLSLTPGLGPVLIGRLIAHFGSPGAALTARAAQLTGVSKIGEKKAAAIVAGMAASAALADAELALAAKLGVSFIVIGSASYPPLLAEMPDPPPVLYVRGEIRAADADGQPREDRYTVGIVGSRTCTHYGVEQAERFAAALAQAGLTIVSGGARGIDTAAHRAALRVKGRTIAVVGSGLAECYPPDNAALFDEIAGGGGAVISELPLRTPPNAENFPARNRIIAGLSLGTMVIEAGKKSGALITARAAVELGREVFALPGRVDSAASEGSLELLKEGAGALVTSADDVLRGLESGARHLHAGTHAARFAPVQSTGGGLFASGADGAAGAASGPGPSRDGGLSESQRAILAALAQPMSMDDLARATGAEAGMLRADLTILEVRRRVKRSGTLIAPVK